MGAIKSYPKDLQPNLVHSLKALGFELCFFGLQTLSPDIDLTDSCLHDLTRKTTIPELITLLELTDLVIGVDSFVSHLAALLGKPTVVLLSSTNSSYFKHYERVSTIASGIRCAPCFHTGDRCPQGHKDCLSFHHETIIPDKIISTVIKKIALFYGRCNG
jgi:ADP-heptose:LPS heptosyltransferase